MMQEVYCSVNFLQLIRRNYVIRTPALGCFRRNKSMTLKYTEEYLKLFDKYQEDIVWTLRQQEKLRLEYIMFLKKDLPEILLRQKIKRNPFNKKIYEESVKQIIEDYSGKIEKSINLLSINLVEKIKGNTND